VYASGFNISIYFNAAGFKRSQHFNAAGLQHFQYFNAAGLHVLPFVLLVCRIPYLHFQIFHIQSPIYTPQSHFSDLQVAIFELHSTIQSPFSDSTYPISNFHHLISHLLFPISDFQHSFPVSILSFLLIAPLALAELEMPPADRNSQSRSNSLGIWPNGVLDRQNFDS